MTDPRVLSWQRFGLLALLLAWGASYLPARAATGSEAVVSAERLAGGGDERGRVLVYDREVLTILTSAGGLTGYERALIVAKRLNGFLTAGLKPEQVRTAKVAGMFVVQAADANLITVTADEAAAHGQTAPELAAAWASALNTALRMPAPPPAIAPAPVTPPAAPPPTPVPAEPLQLPVTGEAGATDLGTARVEGLAAALAQVKAVALVESSYKQALSLSLLVPISTATPGANLERVQGVGVTGVMPGLIDRTVQRTRDLQGKFAQVVNLFGADWVLQQYGADLNAAINEVLRQRQADLKALTRVVPLLAPGGSTAIGAAQVTGPWEQVERVAAVIVTSEGSPRGLLPVLADHSAAEGAQALPDVVVSALVGFPS